MTSRKYPFSHVIRAPILGISRDARESLGAQFPALAIRRPLIRLLQPADLHFGHLSLIGPKRVHRLRRIFAEANRRAERLPECTVLPLFSDTVSAVRLAMTAATRRLITIG
ncbi:hypothetical protein X759_08870 [Mesorhizobium sp. LSHC420B00]|nr:hypothetical protein X759_08870 [Mesorhizobium sp. LSHC420B00]